MIPSNPLRNSCLTFVLLLSGSLLSLGSPFIEKGEKTANSLKNEQNCEEIEVEIQITHTSNRQSNGEILFVFKTNQEQYTLFIFSGNDSRENRLEIRDYKVTELKKGEYNLYIQNKAGCTKHVKTRIN